MQIQPYNDRIQLSLSTIAFTDNKERAAGMNLKEVYEIFYPGKCGKLPSVWKVPPKYDGLIIKSGMTKREEADSFQIAKKKHGILQNCVHICLNIHGLFQE